MRGRRSMLDVIEQVGNKVPHPAIMFLALCGIVIVLSQVLDWLDVGATYEAVQAPEQTVVQQDVGGSVLPGETGSREFPDAEDYEVVQQTVHVKGLLTVEGVRFLLAAVKLGDAIESMNISAVWLLLIVVLVTIVVDLIIPQAIAKWALLAPIFIPMLMRVDVDPDAVLAAYRVGDSPANIVTPIMAYFPLVVVFAARYDRRAGIGTVIALMLPYFVVLTVGWTAFFLLWHVLGIPWGF